MPYSSTLSSWRAAALPSGDDCRFTISSDDSDTDGDLLLDDMIDARGKTDQIAAAAAFASRRGSVEMTVLPVIAVALGLAAIVEAGCGGVLFLFTLNRTPSPLPLPPARSGVGTAGDCNAAGAETQQGMSDSLISTACLRVHAHAEVDPGGPGVSRSDELVSDPELRCCSRKHGYAGLENGGGRKEGTQKGIIEQGGVGKV
jgi:hypothetical protein